MRRRRLLVATLLLAGSAFALPECTAAQGPSPAEAATRLRLASAPAIRTPSAPARNLLVLPDSVVQKRKDHTVTGLLIGGGLGLAAGWAFYDTICEAVDNRCSPSRVGLVVLGTATGASLGALIGSLAD